MYFVVLRRRGPHWDPHHPLENQWRWDEHAEYMNQLVSDGFVVLGGPLGDQERVVLAVEADSEAVVRARLSTDPWSETVLVVESVDTWEIRLDARRP